MREGKREGGEGERDQPRVLELRIEIFTERKSRICF